MNDPAEHAAKTAADSGPVKPTPTEPARPLRFFTGLTPAGRWTIAMGLVMAAALAAFFSWQPLYKRVKYHRGVRMAREANRLIDAGDVAAAARLTGSAIRFAPTSPEASRLVARVSARMGEASGLARWGEVLGSGIETREDWAEASRMAVQFGRMDLSGPWLRAAIKAYPDDVRFPILTVRHFLRAGDRRRAVQFARQTLQKFPSDPEVEYETGRVFSQSGDADLNAEGQRLLWDVAAGNSRFREDAVEALASKRNPGRLETESLIRLVESKPDPVPGLRMLILELRARLDPGSKAASIRSAIDLIRDSTNTAVLARIVGWLNRNGGIAEALPALPVERCRTNPVLMGARFDSLIALGRTEEIDRLGAQSTDPVSDLLAKAARGVVAIGAGRRGDGEAAFRQVIQGRPRSAAVLSFVASRAEASGMTNVAIEAHLEMLPIPGLTLDSGKSLLRLSRPLDDQSIARRALRALNTFAPGDETVAAERAWMEAVFGDDKDFALTALEHMSSTRTNQPGWKIGHALALWRKGDSSGALSLIESGGTQWEKMEPRAQAAYVAVLGANDQREASRKLARRIDLSRLHAQERLLVQPYL